MNQSLNIAFIMDPLETVKAYKDTTYFIMLAARQRGHRVFFLEQNDLYVRDNQLHANVIEVDVHENHDQPFTRRPVLDCAMDTMDAVLIRTDPPFDRRYFYTTLLLDLLPPSTRVINRPQGLRNWNEKLAALFFGAFTPGSLITQDTRRLHDYIHASEGRVTLKPIDGHGGRGILFVKADDPNLDQLLLMATHAGSHRVIAQQYVPSAKDGDKRILLLNGKPLGAILRLHPEGKELNNMDAGGTPHPWEMTEREYDICNAIEPHLKEQGILFAGIDILGDELIEINVTSPTGLQELCRFSEKPFHHDIVAAIEAECR